MKKLHNKDFALGSDDLIPLFLYVVVRSRIQHLGAEIHFIHDLCDVNLDFGELGFIFTTLKVSLIILSCSFLKF